MAYRAGEQCPGTIEALRGGANGCVSALMCRDLGACSLLLASDETVRKYAARPEETDEATNVVESTPEPTVMQPILPALTDPQREAA